MTTAATRLLRQTTPWDGALWRRHPIFWPVAPHAALFEASPVFPPVERIDAALAPAAGVRFRPQATRPKRPRVRVVEPGYDTFIVERGEVPTREGSWHDFMNALVWASFPRSKLALHRKRQGYVAAERASGDPGRRLPAHDAISVLDEGGVLVVSPRDLDDTDALLGALDGGEALGFAFGHAILEAIAIKGPWPLVRALVLPVPPGAPSMALVDEADRCLAALLDRPSPLCSPKDLLRLPLERIAWLDGACGGLEAAALAR